MTTEEEYESYVGKDIGNKKVFTDRYGRIHKRYFTQSGEEIIKHSTHVGCKLVSCRKQPVDATHLIKHMYCIVHDVETSRCGIPYGRIVNIGQMDILGFIYPVKQHRLEQDFKKYYAKDIPIQNGKSLRKRVGKRYTL